MVARTVAAPWEPRGRADTPQAQCSRKIKPFDLTVRRGVYDWGGLEGKPKHGKIAQIIIMIQPVQICLGLPSILLAVARAFPERRIDELNSS